MAAMLFLIAAACSDPKSDSRAGVDTSGADTQPDYSDTAACIEDSSHVDTCCWSLRPETTAPRLIVDSDTTRTGADTGVTVMTTEQALDAWWTAAGLAPTGSIDWGSEVAVGYIGDSAPACDEQRLDGLRVGNSSGSWFAGIYSYQSCSYYYDACVGLYVTHATLYAAPAGAVDSCVHGSFCDG